MKKSLFALAALGAFAGAANAQSSVTLYGTFDTAVGYVSNIGPALGTTASTSSTASPAAGNMSTAFIQNQIATSVWGLKGEEDLGGGMKALFNVESDLSASNGAIWQTTAGSKASMLFRRAANVGLAGSFGEVRLGVQGNPLVAASAAMTPVEGNTVNQVRTAISYSIGDYMANAVSYQTPNLNGFQAKVAYAASNTIDDTTGGSVIAANAFYTLGNLNIAAGYNKQNALGLYSGATAISGVTSANYGSSNPMVQGSSNLGDLTGYVAGLKYKVTPAIQVSYSYGHSDYSTGASASSASPVSFSAGANIFGLGYQATPSLLLGANYIVTTADSTLSNVQARYSLSKRTTLYFQGTIAKNGAGAKSDGTAFGNFIPVQTDTSKVPNSLTGEAGLANTTQSAYSVGIIHNF